MRDYNKNPLPFLIVMNVTAILFSFVGGLMVLVATKDIARLGVFMITGTMLLCTAFIILGLLGATVWGPSEYRKALKNFRK